MNRTIHLFQKDLRHLKWLLLGWLGLLGLEWLIFGLGLTSLARDTRFFQYLGYSWNLISLLSFLLMTLTIARLVHSDPQVGTTAFWMTRPISRRSLLGEKVLFLGLFLIVLPIGLELSRLRSCGFNHEELWFALQQLTLSQPILALGVMALASGTADLSRTTLAGILLGVSIYIAATLLMFFRRLYIKEWDPERGWMESSMLVMALLVISGLLVLVAHQYLTRKVYRSGLIAALALPLVLATANFWRWDILGFSQDWADPSVLNPEPIRISIDFDEMLASADSLREFSLEQGRPKHRLGGGLVLQGARPGMVLVPNKIRSRLSFSDGTTVESKTNSVWLDPNFRSLAMDPQTLRAIESATGGSRLLNPEVFEEGQRLPVWVEIDDANYLQHEKGRGKLSAEVELMASRWEVLTRLPISRGATFQRASHHFDVLDVISGPAGCRLQVRESNGHFLFQRRDQGEGNVRCSLNNSSRRELLLARQWYIGSVGSPWDFRIQRLNPFEQLKLMFVLHESYFDFDYEPARGQPGSRIDRQWLSGAEIVLLENRYLGRVKKSFEVEDFVLSRGRAP